MQKSASPTQFVLPFAGDAGSQYRNTIPIPSQQGTTPGAASFTDGFPPVTMEPIASGGVPPYGADMNGILYELNLALQWQQAGFLYPYSSAFATNAGVNGYPAGSLLAASGLNCLWFNKTDNNQTNPDSSASAGWLSVLPNAGQVAVSTTGGTTTLTPSQLVGPLITVTGALTSNATLVLPLVAGSSYIVQNSTTGAYTLTVEGSTGAGVVVAQGANAPQAVLCDGANWYSEGLSGGPYLPLNGTAQAAVKLASARAFSVTGLATAAGVNFDGTGNVALNVTGLNVPGALGYTPADDTQVVHKAGAETITGAKTFSGGFSINQTNGFNIIGSAVSGQNNSIVQAGDLALIQTSPSGGVGTGAIALTTWSNTQSGIRIAGNGANTLGGNFTNTGTLTVSGALVANGGLTSTTGTFSGAVTAGAGVSLGYTVASSPTDLSHGLRLYSTNYGLNVSSGQVNLVANNVVWSFSAADASTTLPGALTCVSMNATGSDRRLKRNIRKAEPRPLHRAIPYVSFERKADGSHGRGAIAQVVQKFEPAYVGTFEVKGEQRLSLDYQSMAYEQAIWAGREVDRLTKQIAKLKQALARAKIAPRKRGFVRRMMEAIW